MLRWAAPWLREHRCGTAPWTLVQTKVLRIAEAATASRRPCNGPPRLAGPARPSMLVSCGRQLGQPEASSARLWSPFCASGGGRKYGTGDNKHTPASQGRRAEEQGEEPADSQQTIKMMFGIALGASALGAFLNIRAYERRRRREEEHGGGGEGQVKLLRGAAVGKPQLGGEYTLINHDGKVTRSSDFFGSWAFLYFGFTYCPDICPNELARLQEILALLDKEDKGKFVQPIFITIDPERDGPAQLKDYLADWHPRLVGLTGSPAQIDECCKKFRVYANKVVLGKDPGDYLIDHSVMFYLVDPNGEFVDYYGGNLTPAEIAGRMRDSMETFAGRPAA